MSAQAPLAGVLQPPPIRETPRIVSHADISLLNSLNATSLPRRWGGGDGIALAAGLAPTDMLWPCASWPAPQGGDGVVSMSAELLGDQRRANRIRAQLRRYGAEAALPSFEGHANATCPQQSRLLAYLNASLPPFDRPRVVSADLVDGAPVVLLASASGRRADTTLLEVTSREVESSGHGGRTRLRAATARGSLNLWTWWWGPWRWDWRRYYSYWKPPTLSLQLHRSTAGDPLPDRVLQDQQLPLCYELSHSSARYGSPSWFVLPMMVKVEAVDGNTPQCSFAYRGWDYANGRWYYGERWIKGKFDVWNWCARRPGRTT